MRAIIMQLLIELPEPHQAEGLQGLWKQIRAVQPKHRTKRQHQKRDIDEDLLYTTLNSSKQGRHWPAQSTESPVCSETSRNSDWQLKRCNFR